MCPLRRHPELERKEKRDSAAETRKTKPGTRNPEIRNPESEQRNAEHGIRNTEPGTWKSEPGTQISELGTWNQSTNGQARPSSCRTSHHAWVELSTRVHAPRKMKTLPISSFLIIRNSELAEYSGILAPISPPRVHHSACTTEIRTPTGVLRS